MTQASKTKAELRYAEIQVKDRAVRNDIQTASRIKTERTLKLRELRLAKEAQDASEKKVEALTAAKTPAKVRKARVKTE
ncbi:MAG: hypothetical protein SGJ17_14930 [Hyphomicrobiales bacterium]|nr:hypothetical protein [Hyphomicrobiales bacterium]